MLRVAGWALVFAIAMVGTVLAFLIAKRLEPRLNYFRRPDSLPPGQDLKRTWCERPRDLQRHFLQLAADRLLTRRGRLAGRFRSRSVFRGYTRVHARHGRADRQTAADQDHHRQRDVHQQRPYGDRHRVLPRRPE